MSWSPRDSNVGGPGPFVVTRKLIKFLIMFDNSNLLFFPGQFLSGRVIVEVEEDMAVLGKCNYMTCQGMKGRARAATLEWIFITCQCGERRQLYAPLSPQM